MVKPYSLATVSSNTASRPSWGFLLEMMLRVKKVWNTKTKKSSLKKKKTDDNLSVSKG